MTNQDTRRGSGTIKYQTIQSWTGITELKLDWNNFIGNYKRDKEGKDAPRREKSPLWNLE